MPYANIGQRALPWAPQSDTSHDAAVRAATFSQTQGARYLAWLVAGGAWGGTDAEAEHELSMRRGSVCARRNEWMAKGRIMDTHQRRGGCTIWQAVV